MNKERIKKLLDIPADIHISNVPDELKFGDKVLLSGTKKECQNSYEYNVYSVSLRIKEDKFVFEKNDWLMDKKREETTYVFKKGSLNNFGSLSLEECDEDFLIFLINNGYKNVLKTKVLEKI